MKTSVYPGSFDPVTLGHVDIIQRSADVFDKVYVVVMHNQHKQSFFSVEERLEMLRSSTKEFPNIFVDSYDGLAVEYARDKGALALIRGLRAVTDFEFEFKLAAMNRSLEPDIETMFLMTSSEYSFISSSAVKEVASLGGDVSRWVCPMVAKCLHEKYGYGEGAQKE